MDEKYKEAIEEVLASEEVNNYLGALLKAQTNDIAALIDKLAGKQQNVELEQIRNSLLEKENQIRELRQKIAELEAYSKNDSAKKDNLLAESEAEKQSVSAQLTEYQEIYGDVQQASLEYQELPNAIRQRLGNMFGDGQVCRFAGAFCNWNTIEQLWEFVRRRIIEEDTDSIAELEKFSLTSFKLYCQNGEYTNYELIEPQLGERFDSDRHIIKGNKTDGIVHELLLPGIYDTGQQKVKYKALVAVR